VCVCVVVVVGFSKKYITFSQEIFFTCLVCSTSGASKIFVFPSNFSLFENKKNYISNHHPPPHTESPKTGGGGGGGFTLNSSVPYDQKHILICGFSLDESQNQSR
jgi:hypothetical protein